MAELNDNLIESRIKVDIKAQVSAEVTQAWTDMAEALQATIQAGIFNTSDAAARAFGIQPEVVGQEAAKNLVDRKISRAFGIPPAESRVIGVATASAKPGETVEIMRESDFLCDPQPNYRTVVVPEECFYQVEALEKQRAEAFEVLRQAGCAPRGTVAPMPSNQPDIIDCIDCIDLTTGRLVKNFRFVVEQNPDLYLEIGVPPNPDLDEAARLKRKRDLAALITEVYETARKLAAQGKSGQAEVKRKEAERLSAAYLALYQEEYEPPLPPLRPEPVREGSAVVEMWME